MGKFYFYYGTMNAGKTSLAICKAHEFQEHGKKVFVFLPDNVYNPKIVSRNGLEIETSGELLGQCGLDAVSNDSIVIIDEAQFLTEEAIVKLKMLSIKNNVLVFCFGLLTNFEMELFQGSKRLVEVCDSLREVPSMCDSCDRKAQYNFRLSDETEEIVLDKSKYKGLCAKCYFDLSKKREAQNNQGNVCCCGICG